MVGGAAGGRVADGQQLDLLHVDKVRARIPAHADAVTGDAGHVGGDQACAQIRPLFALAVSDAHLGVAGEAAGGDDDALAGCQGHCAAVLAGGVDADYAAVFDDQAGSGGIGHDLAQVAAAVKGLGEGLCQHNTILSTDMDYALYQIRQCKVWL